MKIKKDFKPNSIKISCRLLFLNVERIKIIFGTLSKLKKGTLKVSLN
jgi:hypothetical protein